MNWLWKLLTVTRGASPEFKVAVRAMIEDLEDKARATQLPIDDVAIGILKSICILLGLY